ncbi:serine-rich adhesin for platelets-like [Crassostrea angulata]|uniref:serine-rich adhesin for platelets-like n=1 Tax=Magallana angulata TaxID=2784310 RepID=UPI0022B1820F|nr:serine-rich adhesin for platelets-like [Crassostrea angulata]
MGTSVWIFIVSTMFGFAHGLCNVSMAEKCASQLQELYDSELLSSISSPDQVITESKKDLCLSTISGNSITQCYTTNSKSCVDQDHLAIQWNETMKDATNLCNESCSNYLEFQTCESKILYSAYRESKYQLFCTSYEESLSCASEILKSCKFNQSFFIDLIKKPTPRHYEHLCLTGCVNLDETIGVIDSCYGNIASIDIEDPTTQCESHTNFKSCVFDPDKVCREATQLFKNVYSYDALEIICTTTTSTTTTTTTTTTPTTTTTLTTEPSSTTPTTMTSTTVTTMTSTTPTTMTSTTPTTIKTPTTMTSRTPTTMTSTTPTTMTSTTPTTIKTPIRLEDATTKKETTVKQSTTDRTKKTVKTMESTTREITASVSSAPECVDEEVLKLSTDNQPSTEMCLRLLSLTACLYEKETTRYEDIRAMHSIVGDKVNKILSSGVLRNCTFNVRRDIILIQDLRNSSCAQTQEDSYEDEDLPICSGHNYGLIKCKRNGATSSRRSSVSIILSFLLIFVTLFLTNPAV